MNYALSILHIYPTLEFGKDFEVVDNSNGKGPILTWLNKETPQPTQAELESAWLEVEALQQAEQVKKQKSEEINARATLSDQLNAIAGVLDTLTSENPDQEIIDNAKAMFKDIKDILNN